MKIKLLLAPALAGFVFLSTVHAGTIVEDFSHDPSLDGWQMFGDTNLFQWDSVNHNLRVTWDSSQPNSYFYHPLDTVLGRYDDFSMAFDLVLTDYAIGVTPGETNTFEVATGFLNYSEATNSLFLRGSYPTQPDLAEFDFFPSDSEPITNSINPSFVDSANDFAYNTYGYVTLPVNVTLRVTVAYTATNQTAVLTVTTNGINVVAPSYAYLDYTGGFYTGFGDFHLDTFAVESYSGVGSYYGSLLAHGTVGNILLTLPPPPVTLLQPSVAHGVGQVQFNSRTNWNYILESSTDLTTWQTNGSVVIGTGGSMVLQDTNAAQLHQFYRVNAQRAD